MRWFLMWIALVGACAWWNGETGGELEQALFPEAYAQAACEWSMTCAAGMDASTWDSEAWDDHCSAQWCDLE